MNLLETILNAQGGGAVRQLADQFGLSEGQTESAISALLPALAGAVNQNTQVEGGLESLLSALSSGHHDRYLENPATLADPTTVDDGNGILGHLFGDRSVSRAVASNASAQTGLDSGLLRQMLPLVASLLMGGLSKQASNASSEHLFGALGAAAGIFGGGDTPQPASQQSSGLLGVLTPLIDQNRDGSALDDVLRMASGFLRR